MTDEELDIARGEEAMRLWSRTFTNEPMRVIAARLAREGWMPPMPEPEVGSVWKGSWDHNYRVIGIVGEVGSKKFPRTVVYNMLSGTIPDCKELNRWHGCFTLISASEEQDQ